MVVEATGAVDKRWGVADAMAERRGEPSWWTRMTTMDSLPQVMIQLLPLFEVICSITSATSQVTASHLEP